MTRRPTVDVVKLLLISETSLQAPDASDMFASVLFGTSADLPRVMQQAAFYHMLLENGGATASLTCSYHQEARPIELCSCWSMSKH